MIESGFPDAETIEVESGLDWRVIAGRCAERDCDSVVLVGDRAQRWAPGTLVAVDPTPLVNARRRDPAELAAAIARIDRRLEQRRRVDGGVSRGIVVLASYDLLEGPEVAAHTTPSLVAWEVDRSVTFATPGKLRLNGIDPALSRELLRDTPAAKPVTSEFTMRDARSSLPRQAYIEGVEHVRREIAAGEIYQANLCQMLEGRTDADAWEWFLAAERRTPAPRSAFISCHGFSLASLSPEIFVTVDPAGLIESWPIKGTRAREADPERDRRAREALLASEKDRAELLMIVDLERNDLSRICVPGSVEVPRLAECHSYPAVHHLVAQVRGRLRDPLSLEGLLRATFPGGSITGAPKLSAIRVLRRLERAPRGYFTGSLFWFGDDGTVDSSILIRTCVFSDGLARIGAGGGIVTDSEPQLEWREANDKARALTRLFGLEPEAFH